MVVKASKRKFQKRQFPEDATRRHRQHKWLTIIFFAILIAIATIIIINLFQPVNFQDQPNNDDTSSDTIKPENVKGTSETNEAPEEKTTASDGTPLGNEGPNPNTSSSLTGAITFSSVSEGKLMIRTNIDQYLSSGTCDLSLTSNTVPGVSYTWQAPIIASVSTSTCDGFDYEASEIRPGNYSITINLTSGDRTGILKGELSL